MNNVVYGHYQGLGISGLQNAGPGLMVANNILQRPDSSSQPDSAFSNNIYTDNQNSLRNASEFFETNLNNLFVDYANGDYHLAEGSPAINAGADLSGMVDEDLDGMSRPQFGAWDVGPYEYTGANPPPPPPPPATHTPAPPSPTPTATPPADTTFSNLSPGDASSLESPVTLTGDVSSSRGISRVALWGDWSGTWQEESVEDYQPQGQELLTNGSFESFSGNTASNWNLVSRHKYSIQPFQ